MAHVVTTDRIDYLLEHALAGLDETTEYARDWESLDDVARSDFTSGWSLVKDRLSQLAALAESNSLNRVQAAEYAELTEREASLRPMIEQMLRGAAAGAS